MTRFPSAMLVFSVAGGLPLLVGASAHADIPVGYKGKPFDPGVAGGPKLPASVKGGPYTIPGRLDFINYDMGGDGVGYHTALHETKGGAGYRVDGQTATLSYTGQCIPIGGNGPCTNVWYDTSATLDGTKFPSPTTDDFTLGAVSPDDWFNITVNVTTAGTYALSSTWASGSGPLGGEGGDGTMGVAFFSNGTMLAQWAAVFPNFNMYADYHHWKAYPSFATVTLAAGPQVIKVQSTAKHLQFDYVQLDLVDTDGGAPGAAGAPADGGMTGAGGSGAGGAPGAAGDNGAAGSTDTGGTSGDAGAKGASGAAGTGSATGGVGSPGPGAAGTSGAAGATTTGAAGRGGTSKSGGGCALAPALNAGGPHAASLLAVVVAIVGVTARGRRQRRRRR
jgi:hypothetical protein